MGLTASYSGTAVPGEVMSDVVGDVTGAPYFTGVRLLANATQTLVFESTATSDVTGTFQLQVGSVLTGAIAFDSNNLPGTAANIQNALISAGYSGTTVSVVSEGTSAAFSFDVSFEGASADANLPALVYVPGTLPSTITFVPTSDPYTQQANINYTNPQYDPAIAMDPYGNFVIVWANQGQDVSWFNNISMERFDKNGNPVAFVGSVNNGALTNLDYNPDVAIGYDGNVVVTWSETTDPTYLVNQGAAAEVYARAFNAQSSPLWNEIAVGGGGDSTVSMDGQDNFIICWEALADNDVNNQTTEGIYAVEYQLESYTKGTGSPATGKPLAQPTVLRNIFRVNSGSVAATPQPRPPFSGHFRRLSGLSNRRRPTCRWISTGISWRRTRATGRPFRTTSIFRQPSSTPTFLRNRFSNWLLISRPAFPLSPARTTNSSCRWDQRGHQRRRSRSTPTRQSPRRTFKPRY